MKSFITALIGALVCASPALAGEQEDCAVAAHLVTADYPLPRVARAIAQKELKVVVVGSASSLLAGPGGKQEAAYPTRLESALSKRLPGVKVTVATFAKPRTTADSMEEDIERLIKTEKPAVLIWQTGTVDAIRRIDLGGFSLSDRPRCGSRAGRGQRRYLDEPAVQPAHGIDDRSPAVC